VLIMGRRKKIKGEKVYSTEGKLVGYFYSKEDKR